MSATFDPKKFVFHETFTNQNGKQSGSGFVGVILCLVGAAAFIAAMVGYFLQIPNTLEIMGKILELVAAATILLGVRKISGNFVKTNGNGNGNVNNTNENVNIRNSEIVENKG
jgi:hypothetical protein